MTDRPSAAVPSDIERADDRLANHPVAAPSNLVQFEEAPEVEERAGKLPRVARIAILGGASIGAWLLVYWML